MSKKQQLITLLNKQLYAKNPHLAVADAADTQLMAPILERFLANLEAVKPIVGEDYFTEADKSMFYSALYHALRGDIKDGAPGPRGPMGVQGERGEQGREGRTPQRGVDYFTMDDVNEIVGKVLKLVPKPKDPEKVDVEAAMTPHLEAFKKNLPSNDSVLVSILKDPKLRMLLHGGGSTSSSSSTTFTDGEVVSGSGTAWTLAASPTAGSVQLFANGQRLKLTDDYTIAGAAITTINSFSAGALLADYRS